MQTKWIDTHAHSFLYPEETRAQILQDMTQSLEFCFEIGLFRKQWNYILDIVKTYENIYGFLGIHPSYTEETLQEDLSTLEEELIQIVKNPKLLGLGEVGLDFYRGKDFEKEQRALFSRQLEFVQSYPMPVVIHARAANLEVVEELKKYRIQKSIFHCFSGTQEELLAILDAGYFVSFTGIVTFPKEQALREMIKKYVPLDRFCIETDSPYLAPQPFRGKTNFPSYVAYIGETLSELYEMPVHQFRQQMQQNTKNFFFS